MLGFVRAPLGGLGSVLHVSALPERRAHHSKLLAAGVLALMLAACGGGGGGGDSGTGGGGGGGGGETPLPVAAFISGTSDTPTLPGSLANGSTTDDTTPSLSGTLSAALAAGQKVQVFDGDTPLQPAATVTGLQWQFTPQVPLTEGEHRMSAAVLGADGKVGARSSLFVLTVAETKVTITAAISDTPTQPGILASGASTDDTTPTLAGSINITLAAGQRLQVYDGDVPLAPEATVTGPTWQFTPSAALMEGDHQFSVALVAADGRVGARSPVFMVTVAVPGLQKVSPNQVVRATPTLLTFSGSAWPTAGLSVLPMTDQFDTCTSPNNVSATSFDVTCDFQKMGVQPVELRLNGQTIGQAQINVTSNVSNVTWRSLTTNGSGRETVRQGEVVTFKVTGTQLLQGGRFSLFLSDLSACIAPTREIGSPSQTERQFECTLSDVASLGSKTIIVQDNALGSGAIQKLWESETFSIGSRLVSASKLAASGITTAQCYQAGSDTLVACSSAGAIALSGAGKQDGMLTNVNPMSYSSVGSYSKEECVKDNVTGLIWEGKTAVGPRAGSNLYTNYDDPTQPQVRDGSGLSNPSLAQINAATNSVGYNTTSTASHCVVSLTGAYPRLMNCKALWITAAPASYISTGLGFPTLRYSTHGRLRRMLALTTKPGQSTSPPASSAASTAVVSMALRLRFGWCVEASEWAASASNLIWK